MLKSQGVLRYSMSKDYGYRLVLDIDRGIQMFYRSLIPKWVTTNSLRAHPHITLVRRNQPPNLSAWGAYEKEIVSFEYNHYLHSDEKYWWLNCYSKRLEDIYEELGFQITNYVEPAEGYKKVWHTTVANMKGFE